MVTKEWLHTEPNELELSTNKDGSTYMGIDVIKPKLSKLDDNWSTTNFKSHYFSPPSGGGLWLSCSLELHVNMNVVYLRPVGPEKTLEEMLEDFDKKLTHFVNPSELLPVIQVPKRTLVGVTTFDTQEYYDHKENTGNTNWDAVGLSLCIVSAAKNLGPAFGSTLNKGREEFLNKDDKKNTETNDKIKNTLTSLSNDLKKKK